MYRTSVGSILSCVLCFAAQDGLAATFTPLGYLPGGSGYSFATSISGDGTTVVGESRNGAGSNEAFRWTKSLGMQGLGDLPGGEFQSRAYSASTAGDVVVGIGTAQDVGNLLDAFRWTSSDGMQPLGYFPKNGFFFSYGVGVSGDGRTAIGDGRSASGNEAFRWTSSEGLVGLGDLPGGPFESYAADISQDGSVIVGSSKSSTFNEPFRWTAGQGMVGLGYLPGRVSSSYPNAVSPDGGTIVGYDSFGGWRWTSQGGFLAIPGLAGVKVAALGVSADGSVIVGAAGGSPPQSSAIFWDAVHGTRSLQDYLTQSYGLDLRDWKLTGAYGISDDGMVICGSGINPLGTQEGWVVNLAVPEPATLGSLFVMAIAALMFGGRERRRVGGDLCGDPLALTRERTVFMKGGR
jgi:probable HAF family extracellular repeat protein